MTLAPGEHIEAGIAPESERFFDATQEYPFETEHPREAQLLDAARRCLIRLGSTRMSLSDVARAARLSRPTVYKYCSDKETLVATVVKHGTKALGVDLARAMDMHDSLADQLVVGVHVLRHWVRASRTIGFISEEELSFFLTSEQANADAIKANADVLLPFIERAKRRREVRRMVDSRQASEWLSHVLLSVAVSPGYNIDVDDADDLRDYLECFVVQGLGTCRHGT